MYQFTEMFRELNLTARKKTYRWHGLGAGIVLGWLPAWAVVHGTSLSGWFFPLVWLAEIPLGYFLGKIFRKKP